MTAPIRRFIYPLTVAALLDQPTDTFYLSDLQEIDDLLRGCIDLRVPFTVLASPPTASHPGYTIYVPDPLPPHVTLNQLWDFIRAGIALREEEDRKDREAHAALETHSHGEAAHA